MPRPAADPARKPLPAWLPGPALVVIVFLAYARVWHAGFIWDDDDHLTRNACIIGPLGFKAIWTSSKAVYYPLVLTSFWVQHAIWGLNPLPYHLVDVALHAACALVLWRVLLRLGAPAAWLGAAVWALHPVQVESAAWITEQKNTQSCLFYLLCILFFLRWVAGRRAGANTDANTGAHSGAYAGALLCAVLAILSKSSTVMLPVVLALCWWWQARRAGLREALWLAPFFLISAAAGAWTIWEQKYANHALGVEWSQTWPERLVVGGKDIWFYLGKLAWPHPLTFIYPAWNTDASRPLAWMPLLLAVCALGLLWRLRNGPARPVFFAAAYFVVSLFPVLSLFNVYFFRYTFVGDHFQYLASIGPLAGAGVGLGWMAKRAPVARMLAGGVVALLAALTFEQCAVYYSLETLWRATLADNPAAWIAHFNLADILVRQGKLDEAITHYRAELELRPRSTEAHGNLANVLLMQGKTGEALAEFDDLLRLDPDSAEGHANLASTLLRLGRASDAIPHAEKAVAFSRHPDAAGEEHDQALMLRVLASAYAHARRYTDAAEAAGRALGLARARPDPQLADAISHELAAYRAASPH